jgi:hypothetical protein
MGHDESAGWQKVLASMLKRSAAKRSPGCAVEASASSFHQLIYGLGLGSKPRSQAKRRRPRSHSMINGLICASRSSKEVLWVVTILRATIKITRRKYQAALVAGRLQGIKYLIP